MITPKELLNGRRIISAKMHYGDGVVCGVYIFVHRPTGRMYIGCSVNLYAAIATNKCQLSYKDYIMKELGVKDFYDEIDIVYSPTKTLDLAVKLKQHVLNKYMSTGILFNQSEDAVAGKQCKHRPESIRKMLAVKGTPVGSPVMIDSVRYPDIVEAAVALGIPKKEINRRVISKNYPNYIETI